MADSELQGMNVDGMINTRRIRIIFRELFCRQRLQKLFTKENSLYGGKTAMTKRTQVQDTMPLGVLPLVLQIGPVRRDVGWGS